MKRIWIRSISRTLSKYIINVDPDGASADPEECVVRPALLINLKNFPVEAFRPKKHKNEHGG